MGGAWTQAEMKQRQESFSRPRNMTTLNPFVKLIQIVPPLCLILTMEWVSYIPRLGAQLVVQKRLGSEIQVSLKELDGVVAKHCGKTDPVFAKQGDDFLMDDFESILSFYIE